MWSDAVFALHCASSWEPTVAGDKPPFRSSQTLLPTLPTVDMLWSVQHSPPHRERIYFQRECVHSQQPLPWSCSSHSNYSNSPHIIFPQASCVSPSVPWMGTQKCKAAPQSSLGSHDLKHQNMEQLKETGKSTAFHQETEDLSVENTKGKAQLNTNTPLGERERR